MDRVGCSSNGCWSGQAEGAWPGELECLESVLSDLKSLGWGRVPARLKRDGAFAEGLHGSFIIFLACSALSAPQSSGRRVYDQLLAISAGGCTLAVKSDVGFQYDWNCGGGGSGVRPL